MSFMSKGDNGGSGGQTGGAQTPSNVSKNWGQRAMEWQKDYGQGGANDPSGSLVNYPQGNANGGGDMVDIQKFLDSYMAKLGIKDETVKPLGTKINY
jgi:hypothetical protein